MRIAVVGGGASGVFFAIKRKLLYPTDDITIFDGNSKLLKKLYATGNGKCNFANSSPIIDQYNNLEFVKPIFDEFSYNDLVDFFSSIGIISKYKNELIYPYSESSETVAVKLLDQVSKLCIGVKLEEKLVSYIQKDTGYHIVTDKNDYLFDRIVFCCGGCSGKKFGTEGNLFDEFKKHNYSIKNPSPSLCPIKVKENVKSIEGCRHKVKAGLYQNGILIHKELGELLIKKDGLSGIVIMNLSSYLNRLETKNNLQIHINFAPDVQIDSKDYSSYLNQKLAKYLSDRKLNIQKVVFNFDSLYSFEDSQVTSGGIKLENVDKCLSSKLEKGIYFIGEILDIDAVCGGFNLMWAFSSANYVANKLK